MIIYELNFRIFNKLKKKGQFIHKLQDKDSDEQLENEQLMRQLKVSRQNKFYKIYLFWYQLILVNFILEVLASFLFLQTNK